MRHLGFLLTSVLVAAVAACAADGVASSQGSNLTGDRDAAAAEDGGPLSDAGTTDGSADATADATTAVDAGPTVPTYEEIAPIVEASCAGCHDDQFATLDAVKEESASMLLLLKRGKMPKGNPTFTMTPDGQKLVAYLTSSPDLQ